MMLLSLLKPPSPSCSYGKGELAMCYIRNVAQQSAVNLFNEWIRTAPDWNNACWPWA